MTINKVEAATGLDRATIRYYEREKLISPERGENGYRDYSQHDVERLERIKLLRALGFSIEDIRSMDGDAAGFRDRLRARAKSLEAAAGDIEARRRVIDEMLRDNARYDTLQSRVYLQSLASRAPALSEDTPEEPGEPEEPDGVWVSPWRRFFARWLDYQCCSVLLELVWVILLRLPRESGAGAGILKAILVMALILALEPVMLSLFGTTPGKFILGIRVKDRNGNRPGWRAALYRTLTVLVAGEGLYIPIVSIWRNWRSFKDTTDGLELSWEENGDVTAKRFVGAENVIGFIAASLLVFLSAFLIVSASRMPRNRGALTPAELCRNVNGETGVYGMYLLEDGEWRERAPEPGVVIVEAGGEWEPERVDFTLEDGIVTGFSFRARCGAAQNSFFGCLPYGAQEAARRLIVGLVGADRSQFPFYPKLARFSSDIAARLSAMTGFSEKCGLWDITVTVLRDTDPENADQEERFDLQVTVDCQKRP